MRAVCVCVCVCVSVWSSVVSRCQRLCHLVLMSVLSRLVFIKKKKRQVT